MLHFNLKFAICSLGLTLVVALDGAILHAARQLNCPSGYSPCAEGTSCCESSLLSLPACPNGGNRCTGQFNTICCSPGSSCDSDGLCAPAATDLPAAVTSKASATFSATETAVFSVTSAVGAEDVCRAVGGACQADKQCERQGGRIDDTGVVCPDTSLVCCHYDTDRRCLARGGIACISTDLCMANKGFSNAESLCPGPSFLQCCLSNNAVPKNGTMSTTKSIASVTPPALSPPEESAASPSSSGGAGQSMFGRGLGLLDSIIGLVIGVAGLL